MEIPYPQNRNAKQPCIAEAGTKYPIPLPSPFYPTSKPSLFFPLKTFQTFIHPAHHCPLSPSPPSPSAFIPVAKTPILPTLPSKDMLLSLGSSSTAFAAFTLTKTISKCTFQTPSGWGLPNGNSNGTVPRLLASLVKLYVWPFKAEL